MQPEMLPGPLQMQPGTPPRQTQMQPEMLPKLLQMQPGTQPKVTRKQPERQPKLRRKMPETMWLTHQTPQTPRISTRLRYTTRPARSAMNMVGLAVENVPGA